MKTIKSLKDITTLEVGDVVVFGNLKYIVTQGAHCKRYYLVLTTDDNDKIFKVLNINKIDFIEKLGINAKLNCPFPETKSLEALTAIVSALFKEYEKQNELPKTWEEFCAKYPVKEKETFINSDSNIVGLNDYVPNRTFRLCGGDKNLCTSKQEAEAFLALMQLRQLRKAYVKDWESDWCDYTNKFNILVEHDQFIIYNATHCQRSLSFPTQKLAEQFLTNFKDLLEIAKPLL